MWEKAGVARKVSHRRVVLTNNSSAEGDFASLADAMLSGDFTRSMGNCVVMLLFELGSRKGFLETGRGGGSSNGERGGGGEKLLGPPLGEGAPLRKGLFDERLRVNPGDRPADEVGWPIASSD